MPEMREGGAVGCVVSKEEREILYPPTLERKERII
jgi:hypothetical protein